MSAAPLIETRNLKMPPGGRAEYATMRDGAPIRVAKWLPENAHGTAIILPGATEFIEQFGETIGELLARRTAVGTLDWRGQGLSHRPLKDPHKRHIDDFSTYVEDFREIVNGAFAQLPRPWHLICQSMGGNIALFILSERVVDVSAAVLMAPMLRIVTKPWPPMVARLLTEANTALGRGEHYIFGGGPKSDFPPFKNNPLSHDKARFDRIQELIAAEPRLDVGSPTFGWLGAAYRAMNALARPEAARAITPPLLIFECGEDAVVVNAAIETFAGRLPCAKLYRIAGARHAILLESDVVRAAFWREYDAFVTGLGASG